MADSGKTEQRMDPQRRRLTMDRCDPVVQVAKASVSLETSMQVLASNGLDHIFKREVLGDKRAVYELSKTDHELKKKRPFAEKDRLVLVPPGNSEVVGQKFLLETQVVACTCRKGMKPESPNQDTWCALVVEDEFALYGVFDGHGPGGHDISDFSRDVLVKEFVKHEQRKTNPGTALHDAFVMTQDKIVKEHCTAAQSSGTTCTMVYHDFEREMLSIAHVGDSRCVVGKKVGGKTKKIHETLDHKPNLPLERARIEKNNGRVIFDGFYNYRVFAAAGQYPGLNMSRALGDIIAHNEAGLTAEPDTFDINLAEVWAEGNVEGITMLICTDGVWEFMKSDDALLIADEAGVDKVGQSLAQKSWDFWMADSDSEISDDITAIVVKLTPPKYAI